MIRKNRSRKFPMMLLALIVLVSGSNWHASAQEGSWTAPIIISTPPGYSWFPDLAVDVFGTVHVVWCHTTPLEMQAFQEQVYYTHLTQEGWSEPNDIVPPSADIVRNAIAADQAGNVHLIFGGSVYAGFTQFHQKAPADRAWSASAWSPPHRISQGVSYMGDLAIDLRGVLHVIYDDAVRETDWSELTLADIYYRNSADGGQSWSVPLNLSAAPTTGSARPYMKIDSRDVIHVTWDEGWDRLSGATADEYYSVYVASADGGQTWTAPKAIRYPDATVAQLTVASNGTGGVMLVWRSMTRDQIFYQWSTDGGQTWQEPGVIPRIMARLWTTGFDMYDMTTDSNGSIHLLAVGRQAPERDALLGIYHLVWDGTSWSAPTRVFAQPNLYPEYPKIVAHEGNQLHAVWFTREGDEFKTDSNRVVWYSQLQISAPHIPVTPWPTATVEPTRSPTPVGGDSTPTPDVQFSSTSKPPRGLMTESDQLLQLAIVLSPVVLVIVVLAIVRVRWFRRRL